MEPLTKTPVLEEDDMPRIQDSYWAGQVDQRLKEQDQKLNQIKDTMDSNFAKLAETMAEHTRDQGRKFDRLDEMLRTHSFTFKAARILLVVLAFLAAFKFGDVKHIITFWKG